LVALVTGRLPASLPTDSDRGRGVSSTNTAGERLVVVVPAIGKGSGWGCWVMDGSGSGLFSLP